MFVSRSQRNTAFRLCKRSVFYFVYWYYVQLAPFSKEHFLEFHSTVFKRPDVACNRRAEETLCEQC